MKFFVVLMFFLGGCSQSQRAPYDTFDHPAYVKTEIISVVDSAVANKIKFSELCHELRSHFGEIYSQSRYTNSSIMSADQVQSGFAGWVSSLNLNEGDTLIMMGLDGDQDCNVICDQYQNVVRSAME